MQDPVGNSILMGMMYAHIRPDRIYETGVTDPYNPADPPSEAMQTVARFKRAPWMGENGNGMATAGSQAVSGLGQSPVPTGSPPVNFQQQMGIIVRLYAQMTPAQQGLVIRQLYQQR